MAVERPSPLATRLGFIPAYLRANIATALEYRTSLVMQVFGMFVNDAMWVLFWALYFQRFPVIRGWTLQDVIVLWSTVTFSWGLAAGIFGAAPRLASLIIEGQLDYYLALPKAVLPHILVSQIRLVNLGDMIFGPLLLVFFAKVTLAKIAIFFLASLLASVITLSFLVLVGSSAFFVGSSETLSFQMINMFISFATYPSPIFSGVVKAMLFTLIPAGFVSSIPVELVREFRWELLAELAGGAAIFASLAITVFHLGLRRYESGNMLRMRA